MAEEPPPVLRAAAVVAHGNDLLMVRSADGGGERGWSVPSAPVRGGETMVEAVVRAVRSLTGLDALCGAFLGWYEVLPAESDRGTTRRGTPHEVVACFRAVSLEPDEPTPGSGAIEARWMAAWDVSELPLADGLA
ncbi:MAG TPA: NUDIX domain-containing protein, partial [Microthrixaceae bacterium]|nr:NUDIX domain-containing protein [Microthrixaceae bacterium]HNE74466.1 NUDIX domain-containing protein [Microthrixaceae bacterium]HNH37297.1 NUDIX domain-containing protein [Microthrixaceae bacterium]HNN39714.1 NUDIX domain-containing protein [Microthrixaceae bacterium]